MKDLIVGIFCLALLVLLPAAWFTHIFVCIDTERWGFLVAGAIMIPVAIIHGFMIWLGFA